MQHNSGGVEISMALHSMPVCANGDRFYRSGDLYENISSTSRPVAHLLFIWRNDEEVRQSDRANTSPAALNHEGNTCEIFLYESWNHIMQFVVHASPDE